MKKTAAQWAWLALVAGCGAGNLPYPVRPADVGTTSDVDVARSDSGDAADATLADASVAETGSEVRCPASQSVCGAACVNTNSDPLNCGVCGQVCAPDLRCVAGACTTAFDGGVPSRTYDYVINRMYLDEGAEPGVTTRAFFGFNLDGRYSPSRTASQQAADCSHGDYFSILDSDQNMGLCAAGAGGGGTGCAGGVDNQFPNIAQTIMQFQASLNVQAALNQQISDGHFLVLVRLEGVDGALGPTLNDPSVQVRVYRYAFPAFRDCADIQSAGRMYYIDNRSLNTRGDLNSARLQYSGSIVNGRLRVTPPAANSTTPNFSLPIPLMGQILQLDLFQTQLRVTPGATDGTNGNLGGYLRQTDLITALTTIPALRAFRDAAGPLSQGFVDIATGTPTASCNSPQGGIGVGLGFSAKIATILPTTVDAVPSGVCGGATGDAGTIVDTGTPPVCASGTHLCGSSCVSDTAVTSCGSSCTACPVPTGGSATCSGGACGQSCPSGTTLCGSSCIALTTTANCGACGRVCTIGQACSGGACVSPGDAGTGTCPAGMAYIPAGSFLMGDADTLSNGAQPPHMVTLSAYCMDLTEVTVAAYRGCTARGCTAPSTGTGYNWGVAGRDNHPINGVDWNQSRAYCQWRGGDLPTEAQWEYAARGSDVANHIYPWGNAAPASQLCWSGVTIRTSTCPVQSYPSGNSPFGLFDMAGNVWEWTLDFYSMYTSAAAIDPTGPTSGTNRLYRGGARDGTSATVVRAACRDDIAPILRSDYLGFRCSRGAM